MFLLKFRVYISSCILVVLAMFSVSLSSVGVCVKICIVILEIYFVLLVFSIEFSSHSITVAAAPVSLAL